MQRRVLLTTFPSLLTGIAGCLDGPSTGSAAKSSGEGDQGGGSSFASDFNITNERDREVAVSIRLKMGQDTQPDDAFHITNQSDGKLDVSTQLEDGNRSFTVEEIVLDQGATKRFRAQFVNVEAGMSIAVEILRPQERTYEENEIPVGVPEYDIRIQSDGIDVVWAEN